MKGTDMPELGVHFEYTLDLLADRLVTPARYGKIVVAAETDTPLEFPSE